MPPRAPSQVRVETLIARGRLVLAVFLLLALRVATPRGSGSAFGVALAFLGYAGVLGLLVRTRFGDGPKWPGATHAIDLSVYAICLFLLGGLVMLSSFFADGGAARISAAVLSSHALSTSLPNFTSCSLRSVVLTPGSSDPAR